MFFAFCSVLSADELNLELRAPGRARKLPCVTPRSKMTACERQLEKRAGEQLGST